MSATRPPAGPPSPGGAAVRPWGDAQGFRSAGCFRADATPGVVGDQVGGSASGSPPVCDLVLLTWNRRDLLKGCVERILRSTHLPSRLIIVDNGSTDPEALAYLREVSGTPWVDVAVARLAHNHCIAEAFNAGLARSRAPWVCLLTNDSLVTDGWLAELLDVATRHPSIGLLNPMSNEFDLWPHHGESIEAVAQRCLAHRGEWIEHSRTSAFCTLMPRQVVEGVGLLDEGYQPGYFEDADYSVRVQRAGFMCAIASGTYVYHVGSATMRADPQRMRWFRANEARFFSKWQRPRSQRVAWVLSERGQAGWELTGRALRRLANEDHRVWVFGTRRAQRLVPRHYNLIAQVVHPPAVPVEVLWNILMKKKRFHRIVASDERFTRLLRWLAPIHRADVEAFLTREDLAGAAERPDPQGSPPAQPSTARQRLTVLLLTKDEAKRLPRCLNSVRWADEVVVVDGQSADGTAQIARAFGATVIERSFSGSFSEERNAGLDAATGDWVLQMDADEVATPELRAALERLLATPDARYAAYQVRRRNVFLGRLMRYGGWYHDHLCVFRRVGHRYHGLVHERLNIQGPVGHLQADLHHEPFQSIAQFISRQNRYTTLQARELFETRGRLPWRSVRRTLWLRPLNRWWKFYVKKQGFREGMHGLIFSTLFAWVEFLVWAKYCELIESAPQ